VEKALATVEEQAGTDANLLPSIKVALREGATVGEVSDRLRNVFGVYRPA
jgi:methylmalonyl-CoA mutase N-terminal domain/subunit